MNEIWLELVRLIPALLWFTLAVCLLVVFRARLADLFTRLGAVEAMGIKLVCMRESIEAALDLAEKAPQWQVHVPPEDKRRVLDRARSQYRLIKGAQFLWVDDKPENNVNERRMFRQLDVDIDTATNNENALAALATAAYNLVISDIDRPGQTSGLELTKDLHARGLNVPVVFYVGDFHPELGVPPHAFGITNRPDELLHLCLDILSRKRDS
jgi:response regulator receiver domain-containing protein